MSNWNPNLYLKYEKERTQPSIDLVTRIVLEHPDRVIDIGCGPGNSTQILKNRWPDAHITGLDSSVQMIEAARTKHPGMNWILRDATSDLSDLGQFDVVFSNAAIQWIDDQQALLKKLFGLLNERGALAVQVPCTKSMPVQTELDKLVSSQKWSGHFKGLNSTHFTHSAGYYYDILCGLTDNIELWVTDYYHIMNSHNDIVDWYSGSGLRPYFECLKSEALSSEFIKDYYLTLTEVYDTQSDSKVLFPFTRIFFLAMK